MPETPSPAQSAPVIRPATPADAPHIAPLLRRAVPAPLQPMTILGQSGIVDWIRTAIEAPPSAERPSSLQTLSPSFLVAAVDGTVCGAAEWRRHDQTLFLNGIAVHPDHRNHGLGHRLLRAGLAHHEGPSHVALDVFARNVRAQRWYERLSFRVRHRQHWIVVPVSALRPPTDARDLPPAVPQNAPAAQDHHDRFGFSMLHLDEHSPDAPNTRHEVGRLGDEYVRITDPATLAAAPVRTTLRTRAPSRRLLYLTPSPPSALPEPVPANRVTCKACSLRMRAPRSVVAARLQ